MTKEIRLDYEPSEKQILLHTAPVRQVMYGGAAGGGKSRGLRGDLVTWCLRIPGLEAYLFRKSLKELEDNHVRPLKNELPRELYDYNETKKRFTFPHNGSAINMCYCERDDDVYTYHGAEMHILAIDEGAHFKEFQITYLRTRLRLGSFAERIPEQYRKMFPRLVIASNPGGPGHSFLKSTFITPAPPMTVFPDKTTAIKGKTEGLPTIFIPAGMKDNKYLEDDYEAQFGSLEKERQRALVEGDWDAVVGQALHTLSRERHCLRPFKPPRHMTRIMCIDWGTAKPFAIGWWLVSDGIWLRGREAWPDRYIPAGALVMYDEWYGWNGKSNKGCGMDARTVARDILARESARGDVIDYRVGDTEMWSRRDGPSPAENMMHETDGRLALKPAKKNRRMNYNEILCRLAGAPTYMEDGGVEEHPMMFVTANCVRWWETVPSLVLDPIDPDKGPDTKLEDHHYDQTAYLARSRPYMMTETDRRDIAMRKELRKLTGGDPYATV